MCGLVFSTKTVTTLQSAAVIEKLLCRGPDQLNSLVIGKNKIYAASTRLIVEGDIVFGSMPISDNEDNLLVFNGEIYNYKELAKIYFPNEIYKSDSMFLFDFLKKFSLSKITELNGMFAFVFYESKTNQVYAVRDRLGIKPLFYSNNRKDISFASTIASMLPLVASVELDENEKFNYKVYRHSSLGKTIFKGINEVPPGSYLVWNFEQSKLNLKSYWELSSFYEKKNFDTEIFQDIFHNSVKLRSKSKSKIGILISGGVDSFLVANNIQNGEYFTYTEKDISLVTKDYEILLSHTLLDLSKLNKISMSKSDFREYIQNTNDIESILVSVENQAAIAQISNEIKAGDMKIALTGDGADELFFGYEQISSWYLNSEAKPRDFLERYKYAKSLDLSEEYVNNFLHEFNFSDQELKEKELFLKKFWINVHLRSLLDRLDIATANNAIEARSPFLDYRIVEYALSLDSRYLITNNLGKYPLRQIAFAKGHKYALTQDKIPFKINENSQMLNYDDSIEAQWARIANNLGTY